MRLLHYWWPLAMAASLTVVVQRATGRAVDPFGFAFLLAGVVAAYSLDRVLDRRGRTDPLWLRRVLGITGLAATAVGGWLVFDMPVGTAALVPLFGLVVLAYPRLKSLPLAKTAAVAIAWTWGAIAFPFPDGSWFAWRAWLLPVAAPLALLIAGGSLLCDLKDADSDRSSAVASLPATLGVTRTVAIAVALTAAGAVVALAQHRFGLMIAGLGLSLAAMYPERLARDPGGPLLVDMILTLPGLLAGLHII